MKKIKNILAIVFLLNIVFARPIVIKLATVAPEVPNTIIYYLKWVNDGNKKLEDKSS